MPKAQVAEVLAEHFSTIPVDNERDIITYFLYTVKTRSGELSDNVDK